jgi:ketosteroid isomerase-like protein
MSQENVEVVRNIYAKRLLDDSAGHNQLVDLGIEYVNPADAIDPGVRRGSREVGDALRSLTEAFDRREHRVNRIFDGGEAVVADVIFSGRGATSGAEVTQAEAHTWTFQDGRLVRFEWGRDLTAALEAVGLSE